MSPYAKIITVLTGDLVKSRQVGPERVEQAMQQLSTTARFMDDMIDVPTRFTRFRGDGWQMVVGRPGWTLRACLILLADLRAADLGVETRISVGLGPFDSLGTANLSDATGRAFTVSGHHLDRSPKFRRLLIAGGREADQNWQTAIFDLVEWQSQQWTAAQAEAVAIALRNEHLKHQDIAAKLKISRQAVQLRLAGAGYSALANPLAAFEHLDWETTP
jgi:hypothetical protein